MDNGKELAEDHKGLVIKSLYLGCKIIEFE